VAHLGRRAENKWLASQGKSGADYAARSDPVTSPTTAVNDRLADSAKKTRETLPAAAMRLFSIHRHSGVNAALPETRLSAF
jgi:hypothetical protein